VDWLSVQTPSFWCYIRPKFSNAHHGGAVARHMSRLKTPFQISLCYSQQQYAKYNSKALRSRTTQFNKCHPSLIHFSNLKESPLGNLKRTWTHHIFSFFSFTLQWVIFLGFYELPDDDSSGIETCSHLECHLFKCVWPKFLIDILREHCNRAWWLI